MGEKLAGGIGWRRGIDFLWLAQVAWKMGAASALAAKITRSGHDNAQLIEVFLDVFFCPVAKRFGHK